MLEEINVYCINLDERPDKWEYVISESQKLNINLIRFQGIKRKRGHDGCKESHMTLLKKVKDEEIFAIFEDDFKVRVENPIEIVKKAWAQLPDNWDMFYLGATLNHSLDQQSENLLILKDAWATQSVVYNNQNGVVDYIIREHNRNKFSAFLSDDVQHKFNCFMTYPMVCTQNSGHSDILRHKVNYKEIDRRYRKYVDKNT